MSHDYGLWTRFLVNRDSTFISLLASSQAASERVWAKLEDDGTDERFFGRNFARGIMPMIERSVEKAAAILENQLFPVEQIRENLHLQAEVEKWAGDDWQSAAKPTATALGAIFQHSGANSELAETGSALGRLIYLLDAVEDHDSDRAKGQFNPLLVGKIKIAEITKWVEVELARLQATAEAWLPGTRYEALLEFILLEGVCERAEEVLRFAADSNDRTGKKRSKRGQASPKRGEGCTFCDICTPSCDCCRDVACEAGSSSSIAAHVAIVRPDAR